MPCKSCGDMRYCSDCGLCRHCDDDGHRKCDESTERHCVHCDDRSHPMCIECGRCDRCGCTCSTAEDELEVLQKKYGSRLVLETLKILAPLAMASPDAPALCQGLLRILDTYNFEDAKDAVEWAESRLINGPPPSSNDQCENNGISEGPARLGT